MISHTMQISDTFFVKGLSLTGFLATILLQPNGTPLDWVEIVKSGGTLAVMVLWLFYTNKKNEEQSVLINTMINEIRQESKKQIDDLRSDQKKEVEWYQSRISELMKH